MLRRYNDANKTDQISDYRRTIKEIDLLMDAQPGTREGDRLDILATLAEAWEAKHHQIDAPDPIEAIRFAMEQRGLTRHDLEPLIGRRSRVSEVLNHKRKLTLGMIRRIHQNLSIPADVLIRESGSSGLRRAWKKSHSS